MQVTAEARESARIAEQAMVLISDQAFVTQSRCVDLLLDLLQSTSDSFIRRLITDQLRDIRYAGVVRGDDMRASLTTILTALAGVRVHPNWCGTCADTCIVSSFESASTSAPA